MKTTRRKKSQTVVKDTEPKDKAKGSIEGGRKNFSGPHIWYIYLSSGSYDLQLSKNHQNEVKWGQLKTWNILWLTDERDTLSV